MALTRTRVNIGVRRLAARYVATQSEPGIKGRITVTRNLVLGIPPHRSDKTSPSLDFSRRGKSEGKQGQINENRDELEHSGPWRSNSLGKLRSDSDELAVCSGELWLRGKAILWPCSRPLQILAVRGTRVG